MEKLQKALNKARHARQGGTPVKDRASVRGRPRPAPGDRPGERPAVWDQLPAMTLDEDELLSHRILTLNPGVDANPFDVLRTKIWLLMRENGWKRLAITSPNNACGKSTTACNLTVGFSRQREVKSMLLDFDLRRPSVAKLLGQRPSYDIRAMLSGEVAPQEQMMRLRDNTAVAMARRSVKDPTQLLLSQYTADLLDNLQNDFEPDMMIFDLPPMLVTDDARAVLKNVDCALIVARAEETRVSHLDVCEREVSDYTNVLGVVLNNCRLQGAEDTYYGDYS